MPRNTEFIVIKDVLGKSYLELEGVEFDVTVEMGLERVGSGEFSVNYSTFDEAPIYVMTAFGHQVAIDMTKNANLRERIGKALEAKAIKMAQERVS